MNSLNEKMRSELEKVGSEHISTSSETSMELESKTFLKTGQNSEITEENIVSTKDLLPSEPLTSLNQKNKEITNTTLITTLGMSYDEFQKLDFDEQQKIIRKYHKKNSNSKNKQVSVMIGSGDSSIFITAKKGQKVMIGSGENSCFIEAGLTPEESRKRLDDKVDDAIYSKPIATVKKLIRRLKK